MEFDLSKVLTHLGVNLDLASKPLTRPGVLDWVGRIFDVHPDHKSQGLEEGMEVWSSGRGFAPLDLQGIESWLIDAPRGNHLIIAERDISFEVDDIPERIDREIKFWTLENLASFIGFSIIENKISILPDESLLDEGREEEFIFSGLGPYTIKPNNDFTILEENGIKISSATPVLIPAIMHKVVGKLCGPDVVNIEKWVLNCNGLYLIDNFELLDRNPLLNKEELKIITDPSFKDLLSERRTHNEEMGELLHWWKFDEDSAVVEDFEVLVPGHIGIDFNNKKWVLEGLTGKLYRHN